jgi:hypothetical protein
MNALLMGFAIQLLIHVIVKMDIQERIVHLNHVLKIVINMEYVRMEFACAHLNFLELNVNISNALKIVLVMGTVIQVNADVMLVSKEKIVQLKHVQMDAAETEYAKIPSVNVIKVGQG